LSLSGELKEYCLTTEAFEAKCLKNEVIVMNSAIYGRMRIGRCLDAVDVSSFGSGPDILGCSVDVLHILDERCSLRNQCEVVLSFDTDLIKEKPCHPGLKSYLEAGFDCVTGKHIFVRQSFRNNFRMVLLRFINNMKYYLDNE